MENELNYIESKILSIKIIDSFESNNNNNLSFIYEIHEFMFFKLYPFTLNIIMKNIYYNLSSFYWEKFHIDKISFIKTEFIKMKKIWFFLLILFNIEKKG